MSRGYGKSRRTHVPNRIPVGTRVFNGVLSSVILGYGSFGLYHNDIFLPGKRGPGIHFHGPAAWVIYAAFLCASANLVSVIVDHHDKRNNEPTYRLFARITQITGWVLFVFAMILAAVPKSQLS